MSKKVLLLLAAVAALVYAHGSAPATQAATRDVEIGNFFFSPSNITIRQGAKVIWTNMGGTHTTTSGTGGFPPTPDGKWNSGNLSSGATFERFFNDLGTFPYYCAIHPSSMSGSVVVEPNSRPTVTSIGNRSMDEGDTLTFGVSASDPDGDPLTLTVTGRPPFGTFSDNGNGTGTLSFSPGFNQAGVYPMTVTADDGILTDSEPFMLTVRNFNRPPVAGNDNGTVAEGGTVAVLDSLQTSLLDNDGDPDGGDTLTITTVPVSGPSNGSVTLNSNGTFSYVHDASETTNDGIVYEVCDNGIPVLCDQGTFNIAVTPVNDLPIVVEGFFAFTDLPDGTYTLTAAAQGYLSALLEGVIVSGAEVSSSGVTVPTTELLAGDVDTSGFININDVTAIVASFGSSLTDCVDSVGRHVDLDCGGFVNINDITGAVANFGGSSPQAWVGE